MKTTPNEVKALQAIVDSEYQDGSDPVEHDVWTQYVNPFPNKITQAGVYNSLIKKGLISSRPASGGEMGTVHITKAGMDALTVAKTFAPESKAAVKPKVVKRTEITDKPSLDFIYPTEHGSIKKLGKIVSPTIKTRRIDRAIRLYCTQHQATWQLQVRGPLSTNHGRTEGKDDIVAGAQLDRQAMIALRDAINTLLGSK